MLDANAFCILASPSCNLLLSARTLRAWSLPLDRVVSGWRVIQSQIEYRKAQEHPEGAAADGIPAERGNSSSGNLRNGIFPDRRLLDRNAAGGGLLSV